MCDLYPEKKKAGVLQKATTKGCNLSVVYPSGKWSAQHLGKDDKPPSGETNAGGSPGSGRGGGTRGLPTVANVQLKSTEGSFYC